MRGGSAHRLLLPLIGLMAGIGLAWAGASWPAWSVGGAIPVLLHSYRRPPTGVPSLSLALAGAAFSLLLGYTSGRQVFEPGMVSGDAVCVGPIREGILDGICLGTDGSWRARRVRLVPRLETGTGVFAVFGSLERIQAPTNPGEPDWPALARSQGIAGTLKPARSTLLVAAMRPSLVGRIRAGLIARNQILFADRDPTGLVAAMTLGLREDLSPPVEGRFRRAGLSHLLALSGFHVGVVGLGVYFLSALLLARLPVPPAGLLLLQGVLTAGTVVLYAGLTGGAASTIRAATMVVLVLTGRVLRRGRAQGVHLLLVACWCFLVLDPGQAFRPGLLLSASAVYGLIVDGRGSRNWLTPTFCATVFTAPLVVAHFHQLSPVGLLTNLAAVPLASLVVAAAAAAHALFALIPAAAILAAEWARVAGDLLLLVAQVGSRVRPVAVPDWVAGILAVSLLIGRVPRRPFGRRLFSGGVAGSVLLLSTLRIWNPQPLEVTFLNVGQGDCAVIRTPSGRTVVVDFGPDDRARVLAQFLAEQAVSRVDLAIITHDHQDHTAGLAHLSQSVEFDSLVAPSAGRQYLPDRMPASGDILMPQEQEVRLFVLGPESHGTGVNDRSAILKLQHGSVSFLFLGDAEFASERALVRRWNGFLSSQVVKVAHHGSATSSFPFLTDRVRAPDSPGWAVVSVAARNRYGLPDAEALENWRGVGYRVLTTSTHGAITCRSTGNDVECLPFLR